MEFKSGEVIVIGAMAENRTIGQGEGMPWNVPKEYQHFVDSVTHQSVIIGRRSYDIFGADFDADTFVISRSASIDGVVVCNSIEDAISQAGQLGKAIFIGGGRSIYQMGIPFATRMLLSTIKGKYDGDVSFPEFDEQDWRVEFEDDRGSYILRDWQRK
jgi:dihydrofolate reductase